ncbi:MAG: hypothetical protein DI536_29150 [Archangium gephyra]|uniref:TolC family protein n=1 Tax=Archangium gephyra TaxID=48 RepID=A0A2W5SUH7_9BACT|nr:MAG: hypothetical protein DI536_29150 [Archangium gephyra]
MQSLEKTLVLASALLALPASAETLTLEQAVERARERSPEVQLAARVVDEADATRVGAGVFLPTNPRIFADYRPLVIELPGSPVDPRNGYNVGINGDIEVSGAGFARVEEANRRVEVARAELDWERRRAAARAWVAYIDVLLSDQRVERIQEALAVQKRVADAARERVSAGVAGEPEMTTVQVEVASAERDLIEAQRLQQTARLELTNVLDAEPGTVWELKATALEPSAAPSEQELVERALENRPELAVVKARLALLETMESRLAREGFPKLGLNLGLDVAPASPGFLYAGLALELPVQRNQGPQAVARAQQETEKARLQAQLRRVAREVAVARRSYEARRQQVAVLATQALPSARRTQELIEQGWRAGRFDVFRLTTAARDVLRLEREQIETLSAAWSDWVELQRASGGLNK